ncbi:MAG: 1-acyl-sn-glycerol-3-phosphate acyltransferase [Ferruginibacter sp.]
MLYKLLKVPARLAIRLYCRKISINNKNILESGGPLLIASNHPNSFLDAIILATLFDKPIYSLTRGDTFKKKFYAALLNSMNMLPVYRMSEGAENLEENYKTFEKCKDIFKKNGIVLIFSEGRCINEWKLRPLKKGTARLAMSCWQEEIDLEIIPTAINYQSFSSFGKNVQINFGNIITEKEISATNGYGNTINDINKKLKQELKKITIEIDSSDEQTILKTFEVKQSFLKKIILFLPAATGYMLHAPLYIPIQRFSWKKAKHIDHYDSVMVGLLFILYPFYLLLVSFAVYLAIGGYWWASCFLLLPFCAWSFVQIKKQF